MFHPHQLHFNSLILSSNPCLVLTSVPDTILPTPSQLNSMSRPYQLHLNSLIPITNPCLVLVQVPGTIPSTPSPTQLHVPSISAPPQFPNPQLQPLSSANPSSWYHCLNSFPHSGPCPVCISSTVIHGSNLNLHPHLYSAFFPTASPVPAPPSYLFPTVPPAHPEAQFHISSHPRPVLSPVAAPLCPPPPHLHVHLGSIQRGCAGARHGPSHCAR